MIPIPRVPVSQQSYGQFTAPTASPMQDAGPQQMQQLGASLLNAGASAARIGADLQQDLDQGFLMESDALASELSRNAVGSYRQLAGLPAIEAFQDTQEGLRTKLRNLSDTARSPEQKQRLERILVQRMQDASESMAAHRDVQVRNRAIGGAKAGMESEIQNYLAALGNPDDMKLARDLMMERASELSRHRGEDGDMAKLTLLDATTRMHAGAVDALLAADRPTEALAYLEQHKGEIAAPERAQVARVVQRATVADKAQRLVDDFNAKGMSYADQIEAAGLLFQQNTLTAEERAAVETRAKLVDSDNYQQQNRVANKALADATDFARANRIQSVDQLPRVLRTQLESVGELNKVELFLQQGGQFTTTQLGLRALNSITTAQLLKIQSYDQLEAMFQSELSTDDMAEMAARWRKAHGDESKPGDEEKIDRGLVLRNAARDAGLLPLDRDPTDAEKARHEQFTEAALREATARFGKPTNEQFRAVAREVAFDQITSEGVKVPYLAATKAELQSGYYTTSNGRQVFNKNVSETTKQQILEAIDTYNQAAARQGLPLKPRTMAQVFEEWEKSNVVDRATLAKQKADVRTETFKDTDVMRVYHKVWRSTVALPSGGGYRDPKRTYETIRAWTEKTMRYNGETMTQAEWFKRSEGLSDAQFDALLRVAESEAREREQR